MISPFFFLILIYILIVLWPVRGKYRSQNDTGELFIKTNLRSLVVYLIFLALISISIMKIMRFNKKILSLN